MFTIKNVEYFKEVSMKNSKYLLDTRGWWIPCLSPLVIYYGWLRGTRSTTVVSGCTISQS